MSVLLFLAQSTLAATALLLLVLLLRRPVRRRLGAEAALGLWLAPALALILPPTGLGLVTLSADAAAPPSLVLPAEARSVLGEPEPVLTPTTMRPASPSLRSPAEAVLGLWVLGAAAAGGLIVLRTHAWRRTLLAEGSTPDAALAAEAAGVFRSYRVRPRLVVSAAATTPQVLGLWRPLVAVPPAFQARFSAAERRFTLAHEAAHLAGRDLWLLAAAEAAVAIHWFNPTLRCALAPLRADVEAACDARVLRRGASPAAYAQTLLQAARGGPTVPALTLTHALDGRIDAMRNPVSNTTRLLGTTAVIGLAGLAAAAAQVQEAEREVVIERSGDDDPNFRYERNVRDGRSEVRVGTFGDGSVTYPVGGRDAAFVLLSDPFSELVPPAPKAPPVSAHPPSPPVPPTPRFDRDKRIEEVRLRLPEGVELDDLSLQADQVTIADLRDGGREVVLVNPSDETMGTLEAAIERTVKGQGARILRRIERRETRQDFEFEMERFDEEMDRFGAEMETFGARMDGFGEEMGAWGERMGAVGAAVGRLADACEAHKAGTDAPTVLSEAAGGDTIRAVCARGGGERYRSGELSRFVRRNPDLTQAEKRAFFDNREADSVVSVNR